MSAPVLCRALRTNEGCASREARAAESRGRPRVRASDGPSRGAPRGDRPSPASAPRASCRDPKHPAPQSQSLSRSYGSDLPTSLTYIVLSTRGCSPRRPAAVMSTNGRENQSLPRIFKGLQERTGHHKKCGALPVIKPYLLVIRFHGVRPLTRKENSSQGSRRRLRVQLRYRKSDP